MTLAQIKEAVEEGKKVYWVNENYGVIKDSIGQWLIMCSNGSCVGLTHKDGITMNEEEKEFYIGR